MRAPMRRHLAFVAVTLLVVAPVLRPVLMGTV